MLRIRPFREGFDEEAFVTVFNAVFGDYDDIRSMTFEEMRKLEESPGFSAEGMFIAEYDSEIAGMVNAYVDKLREERKGFIQWLGVLPRFRGRGVAKKLVEKALESLRQRGMKVVETWAQTDREACMRMFKSFGFRQVRATLMMKKSLGTIPYNVGENKEVSIREAQLRDNKEIALVNWLDNEVFKDHFNYRPKPIEETKYVLLEIPWFRNQAVFIATLENQPVGFAIAGIDAGLNEEKKVRYGWILDIGVLKSLRQKGIGTSLMLHSMCFLKSQGMEDALLYVDEMNPTNAIKLYEKLGFKIERRNIIFHLQLA